MGAGLHFALYGCGDKTRCQVPRVDLVPHGSEYYDDVEKALRDAVDIDDAIDIIDDFRQQLISGTRQLHTE